MEPKLMICPYADHCRKYEVVCPHQYVHEYDHAECNDECNPYYSNLALTGLQSQCIEVEEPPMRVKTLENINQTIRRLTMTDEAPKQVVVKDIEDFDVGTITEKGMLVRLIRRQFINNKQDDAATEHLHKHYKTGDSSALRAQKSIFPRSCVSGYTRALSDANVQFYNMTTPWADTGYRLLLVTNYQDFTKKIRDCISRFDTAVDEFVKAYEENIESAKETLGKSFNRSDYSSEDTLRSQFELTVKFTKIPDTNDIRLALPKEEIAEIRKSMKDQMEEAMQNGVTDLWKRLSKVVKELTELPDKKRIHDSLLTNVHGVLDIIPRLNVTGDKELTKAVEYAKVRLGSWEPEDMKADEDTKQEIADAADDVLETMKKVM